MTSSVNFDNLAKQVSQYYIQHLVSVKRLHAKLKHKNI
jgi:hypothetical protein